MDILTTQFYIVELPNTQVSLIDDTTHPPHTPQVG